MRARTGRPPHPERIQFGNVVTLRQIVTCPLGTKTSRVFHESRDIDAGWLLAPEFRPDRVLTRGA